MRRDFRSHLIQLSPYLKSPQKYAEQLSRTAIGFSHLTVTFSTCESSAFFSSINFFLDFPVRRFILLDGEGGAWGGG